MTYYNLAWGGNCPGRFLTDYEVLWGGDITDFEAECAARASLSNGLGSNPGPDNFDFDALNSGRMFPQPDIDAGVAEGTAPTELMNLGFLEGSRTELNGAYSRFIDLRARKQNQLRIADGGCWANQVALQGWYRRERANIEVGDTFGVGYQPARIHFERVAYMVGRPIPGVELQLKLRWADVALGDPIKLEEGGSGFIDIPLDNQWLDSGHDTLIFEILAMPEDTEDKCAGPQGKLDDMSFATGMNLWCPWGGK